MHLKPEFINAPNSSFLNFAITSALQSSWCLLSTMERCHCVACTPVPYSKLSHIGVGAWSCPWWKGLLRRHWPMLNVSGCVCVWGGVHAFVPFFGRSVVKYLPATIMEAGVFYYHPTCTFSPRPPTPFTAINNSLSLLFSGSSFMEQLQYSFPGIAQGEPKEKGNLS